MLMCLYAYFYHSPSPSPIGNASVCFIIPLPLPLPPSLINSASVCFIIPLPSSPSGGLSVLIMMKLHTTSVIHHCWVFLQTLASLRTCWAVLHCVRGSHLQRNSPHHCRVGHRGQQGRTGRRHILCNGAGLHCQSPQHLGQSECHR